jgi:hypothetical protein
VWTGGGKNGTASSNYQLPWRLSQARRKLDELKTAGESTWEEAKEGVEGSAGGVREAVQKVAMRPSAPFSPGIGGSVADNG